MIRKFRMSVCTDKKGGFFMNKKAQDYNLFFIIFLTFLIPSTYKTVRVFLLASIPDISGFSIASQASYLNVLYEIILEAMILPLFFLVGKSLKDKDELENKIRSGLLVSFLIYFIISFIFFIFIKNIVVFMRQDTLIMRETVDYMRLEIIAICISIVPLFLEVIFLSMENIRAIIGVLIGRVVMMISLDTLFLSRLSFSVNLGVNGVALTNIITNLALIILGVYFLKKDDINIFKRDKLSYGWMKEWKDIGVISGVESFVRNMFFMIIILRMVNMVNEQGTYWTTNEFIWNWLLMPVLAYGEMIKKRVAEDNNKHYSIFKSGLKLTTIMVLVWIVSIPFWSLFLQKVMNLENYLEVRNLTLLMLAFYVAFAYNNVVDSIFYGLGRTDLMLWQSIITNVAVYGLAFILYLTKVWVPTLISISILFGIGILVDSIITFILYFETKNKLVQS